MLVPRGDSLPINVTINGNVVTSKKTINILGVIFDSNLQWSNQISNTISIVYFACVFDESSCIYMFLFLLRQILGFMCNNKSVNIEDLGDQKQSLNICSITSF